jgi:hypothetical protein
VSESGHYLLRYVSLALLTRLAVYLLGVCARADCEFDLNGASKPTNCALLCNTTTAGSSDCPKGSVCQAMSDPSVRLPCAKTTPMTCGVCSYP